RRAAGGPAGDRGRGGGPRTRRPGARRAFRGLLAVSLLDLLGEIVCLARLRDQRELRLDPVRVLLFAFEDVLEEVTRAVVAETARLLDPGIQRLDRRLLELEIETELLGHGLADVDLAEPLHVRHALEEEDALDER